MVAVVVMVNWVGGYGWSSVCQVFSRWSFVGLYLIDRG